MKSIILLFFISTAFADQSYYDGNSCHQSPVPGGFEDLAVLLVSIEDNRCENTVRANVIDNFNQLSKDEFCADFSLRSFSRRECHNHYQWTDHGSNSENISYRCMASVYNGRISSNPGPTGGVVGHFSNKAKLESHRQKVQQLQRAYDSIVDDQLAIATDINQYASRLLYEGTNGEQSERKFKCSPDKFIEVMQCNDAEATGVLTGSLASLRRINGNRHITDIFKSRYIEAIESVDPNADVNGDLFSLREMHQQLLSAHAGYSHGDNYYLSDRDLFSNSGNLQFLQFHRTFDNPDHLRITLQNEMDENYREAHPNEELPAGYIEGRDNFIEQQERRYRLSKALLETTKFMLEHYRDVKMDFMPGTKHDYIANYVDTNLMSKVSDVSPEELVNTGWFSMDNGQIKIDRHRAFNIIDNAIAMSEDSDRLETLYIPQSLDDLGMMMTMEGRQDYNRLEERCNSFIQAKENLCTAIETNGLLMNDEVARQCLAENGDELNNEEMVSLAYQYCSGQDDFLFGGEPVENNLPEEEAPMPTPLPNDDRAEIARLEERRDELDAALSGTGTTKGRMEQEIEAERREVEARLAQLTGESAAGEDKLKSLTIDELSQRRDMVLAEIRTFSIVSNGDPSIEEALDQLRAEISNIDNEIERKERVLASIEDLERRARAARDENDHYTAMFLKRDIEMLNAQLYGDPNRDPTRPTRTVFNPDNVSIVDDEGERDGGGFRIGHAHNQNNPFSLNEAPENNFFVAENNERILSDIVADSENSASSNERGSQADVLAQNNDFAAINNGVLPNESPQFLGANKVDTRDSFSTQGQAVINNQRTNDLVAETNTATPSRAPLDTSFESIENRIKGLESGIQQRSTTGDQIERDKLTRELEKLRRQRETLLAENLNTPEAVNTAPAVNQDRVVRNVTNNIKRNPASSQIEEREEVVDSAPATQEREVIAPTANGYNGGEGYRGGTKTETDIAAASVSSGNAGTTYTQNATGALILNLPYGNIELSTPNIATLETIPSDLIVTSPEELNLDTRENGIVFLELSDGSYILFEKRNDGTMFRQQVVLKGREFIGRKPAAGDGEATSAREVIRYDQFRNQ